MLTAIGDVMRRMYECGWITTRDGNCSLRRSGGSTLYVTPSGWRKTILHPEHIVKLAIEEDRTLTIPDGSNPSGELHMHWMLQRDATSTRAVVHGHPTYTVAAMYRGFELQDIAEEFPEIFRYTRVGPGVPAIPAVSRALADATAEAFQLSSDGTAAFDIVGQANHGVCAIDGDPWSAYEHIERVEHVCKAVLASGVTPEEVRARAAKGRMR